MVPHLFSTQDRNPQDHRSVNPPRSTNGVPTGPSVVLVTTPHCPHCRSIRGHIEAVADAGSIAEEPTGIDGVAFIEISAPDSPDLATDLKIKAAPTLVAFRDGEEVTRHIGAGNESDVRRVFDAASGSSQSARRYSISSENRRIRTSVGVTLIIAGAVTSVILLALLGACFLIAGWHDYIRR